MNTGENACASGDKTARAEEKPAGTKEYPRARTNAYVFCLVALSDRHTALIALVLALAGLAAIYLLANGGEPRTVFIDQLDRLPENARVSFSGIVASVRDNEKTVSVRVCDELRPKDCVTATLDRSKTSGDYRAGDTVQVVGRVNYYYQNALVRAERITIEQGTGTVGTDAAGVSGSDGTGATGTGTGPI